MLAKLRPRSVYDVIALMALFVAVSTGGAYATHLVVDSSDVVDNSLTGADIQGRPATSTSPSQDGSLTHFDIKNQTLSGLDVADNSLKGADIDESTLSGVKLSGLTRQSVTTLYDSTSPKEVTAYCPAGTKVVGTGYRILGAAGGSGVNTTANTVANQVWSFETSVFIDAYEIAPTDANWYVTAQAVCANAE